jgi:hypothetical protein
MKRKEPEQARPDLGGAVERARQNEGRRRLVSDFEALEGPVTVIVVGSIVG